MAKLTPEQIRHQLKLQEENVGEVDVSFEEIEKFGNNDSMRKIITNIGDYNRMLKEKITFINPALTTVIPFTRENLYLICAYSGNGKSTIAANVSFPLWKQGKKSLVISNEEPEQDIMFRIGCLELGYNFNDYKKGRMGLVEQKEVISLFPEIAKHVKILDTNYKNGLTMKKEGIQKALEAVKGRGYSCVLIDYFQLIRETIESSSANEFGVLNDLRVWLKQYIRNSDIPVVLFAQLHSLGKRNNKDLDSRIKDCPKIYEASTVVLEVVPNFQDFTSDFIIHKDRFGLAGQTVTCGFTRGKYVECDEEWLDAMAKQRLAQIEGKVDDANKEEDSGDDNKKQ